jgi:hypothetical protein
MNKFLRLIFLASVIFGFLLLASASMGNYQAGVDTPISVSGLPLSDSQKAEILETYAPRVWLSGWHPNHPEGEIYYPSPVEFSFLHNRRTWVLGDTDNWWLETYEDFGPSDRLKYFYGCDGDVNPCQLSDVPVYAFWDEVDDVLIGSVAYDVVDLIYFFWFPYNRGKEVLDTVFGNHVGDWEHVSIRLIPEWDDGSGKWEYIPYQIYLSAHNFGETYSYYDITRVAGTHPVVYAAWGSHGIWKDEGDHNYEDVVIVFITYHLIDYTSEGTAWDTWEYIEAYDYDNQAGLVGNAWPTWMSDDYDNPELGYTDPASGPIKRWGNVKDGDFFGYYRLTSGPTGPVDKPVWDVQDLK